jgi:hypothetical protein
MTKKERLEDLGIILQLITDINDMKLFELYHGRNKDFLDFWSNLDPEKQEDFLHKLPYLISDVKDKLSEVWCIARGDDE